MSEKVLEAPTRIYLNVGDLSDIDDPALFKNLDEVTWCQHSIDEDDIEYVRADKVPDLESLLADVTAIDTWHRGSPSYEHDAGWLKDRVIRLLEIHIKATGEKA